MNSLSLELVRAQNLRHAQGPVPSPCISVCLLNEHNGRCEGCHRNLAEIGRWSGMDDDEKRAVWRHLEERLQQASASTAP